MTQTVVEEKGCGEGVGTPQPSIVHLGPKLVLVWAGKKNKEFFCREGEGGGFDLGCGVL